MSSLLKTLLSAVLLMTITAASQADVLLRDLQGRDISFASLKGKWVLINYWAGWCKTCVEEIPELNRFYRKHGHDSIALFAVNYDALPLDKQHRLIRQLNIQYPSLRSDPAFALGLGDITGVPVTFVFNPKGELVNTLYGGQDVRALEEAMVG
ncbi:MAG: TlpA disulfide reductase family protein [Legionella sp.]|uniref:TlpA disulfide reductase family protein n=1 Tax=Legionella sp. TaxID=459 RepID=UPI00283E9BAE|nr:TlpA disulfide reductase family protein [Legionella sp.]